MQGVTVIVCCYNSEALIADTLNTLAAQEIPNAFKVEVVLVNNNSTDQTVTTAQKAWNDFGNPFPLRIVDQPKAGLSNARIAGLKAANNELTIFCDDDNRLKSDYLKIASAIMSSNPSIGALGGQGKATSSMALPDWFEERQSSYAVGPQAETAGDVAPRRYLYGAGLAVRTALLLNLLDSGFEFWCGGRKGNQLTAGDDSEICRWILLAGYKLWYDPSLQFEHFMQPKRLTQEYFDGMMQGFLAGNKLLNIYDIALDNIAKPRTGFARFSETLSLGFEIFWNYFSNKKKLFHYRFELQQLYPFKKSMVVKPQYAMIFNSLKKFNENQNA